MLAAEHLSDELLEELSPHPDIHALFQHYNELYFEGKLGACSVQWSSGRMTMCAGTCQYTSTGGCIIKLSEPILKLRPPDDLKDTLLHEMVHAYVFLLKLPGAGPDGHGPPFKTRMKLINESTALDFHRPAKGYALSVYHTMHDEVNHYRVHWWQCNRCGHEVKRSMNRPPQEADCRLRVRGRDCMDVKCLFHSHVRNCGGEFIKTKEPEPKTKPKAAGRGKKGAAVLSNAAAGGTIEAAFGKGAAPRKSAGATDLTAPDTAQPCPAAAATPVAATGKRKAGAAQGTPRKAAKTARKGDSNDDFAAGPLTGASSSRDALAAIALNAPDSSRVFGAPLQGASAAGKAASHAPASPQQTASVAQPRASPRPAPQQAQRPAARRSEVICLDSDDDDSDVCVPAEQNAAPVRARPADAGAACTGDGSAAAQGDASAAHDAAASAVEKGQRRDGGARLAAQDDAAGASQQQARNAGVLAAKVPVGAGEATMGAESSMQEGTPSDEGPRVLDEPASIRRQRCAEAALRRFRAMTLGSEG